MSGFLIRVAVRVFVLLPLFVLLITAYVVAIALQLPRSLASQS